MVVKVSAADSQRAKLEKLKRLRELRRDFMLFGYKPYARQKEFHDAGKNYRERCFMAGNQLGKTLSAAAETAMHATGLYPDWWDGIRFHHATRGWAASVNAELAVNGAQRLLYGPITAPGTGMIPKDRIVDKKMARGVPNAIESLTVMHVSGDLSEIKFKGYSDGRESWQAETLDYIWFDEEPPMDVYMEGITRTNNTGGVVYLTFTPLLGLSEVVMRFRGDHQDRKMVNMTIDDVGHYTADEKRKIIAQYLPHELDARTKGLPMLGEGMIFAIAEEMVAERTLVEIPDHWKQLVGLDFGWAHPTAAVRIAYDTENDCVHVISAYRQSKETPVIHAAAIKPWGLWIPVAWPRDGLQTDKGSGEQLAAIYRKEGLSLLTEFAQFPDKRGVGLEAGLLEMLQRMRTGRLKVDVNLDKWWDEFRMYHRKDGKIVDVHDDLICATRYAIMMLRYARSYDEAKGMKDRWAQRRNMGGTTWMSAKIVNPWGDCGYAQIVVPRTVARKPYSSISIGPRCVAHPISLR